MRESPTASAMRIVERDLSAAHAQVQQLVDVLVEAANFARDYDVDYARELEARAWTIAYADRPNQHRRWVGA